MKFTKSKASISAKNQGAMKLQLDVKVMMIDLHAKNELTICKHLGNKSGKLSQDTPVLPQVVKLGHAPNKIQV